MDIAENWKTESLRLTVFPHPNQQFVNRTSWWADVVDSDPETITEQPRNAVYQATGPLTDDAQLLLNVQPERIDWQLSASDKQRETGGLPTISSLDKTSAIIIPRLEKWLQSGCPKCQRIAWGAVLLRQVQSKAEGYHLLSNYLKDVTIDADNSSDFSYSINRPRKFSSGEITINRVSRWSVINYKIFRISDIGSGGGSLVLDPLRDGNPACRLELDINTNADRPDRPG